MKSSLPLLPSRTGRVEGAKFTAPRPAFATKPTSSAWQQTRACRSESQGTGMARIRHRTQYPVHTVKRQLRRLALQMQIWQLMVLFHRRNFTFLSLGLFYFFAIVYHVLGRSAAPAHRSRTSHLDNTDAAEPSDHGDMNEAIWCVAYGLLWWWVALMLPDRAR